MSLLQNHDKESTSFRRTFSYSFIVSSNSPENFESNLPTPRQFTSPKLSNLLKSLNLQALTHRFMKLKISYEDLESMPLQDLLDKGIPKVPAQSILNAIQKKPDHCDQTTLRAKLLHEQLATLPRKNNTLLRSKTTGSSINSFQPKIKLTSLAEARRIKKLRRDNVESSIVI